MHAMLASAGRAWNRAHRRCRAAEAPSGAFLHHAQVHLLLSRLAHRRRNVGYDRLKAGQWASSTGDVTGAAGLSPRAHLAFMAVALRSATLREVRRGPRATP